VERGKVDAELLGNQVGEVCSFEVSADGEDINFFFFKILSRRASFPGSVLS